MADSTRTTRVPRVIGALAIAGVLIGGAYVFSGGPIPFLSPNIVSAESTQALLAAYAQKDSDNDGLPDWEEALYGTDPHNPHSVSPTLTDGEAVAQGLIKPKFESPAAAPTSSSTNLADIVPGATPGPDTLTSQFGQSLLTAYIDSGNGPNLSSDDINTLVQQAITSLQASRQHQLAYSSANENISGTGAAALSSYAAQAEKVFGDDSVSLPKGEIDYFADAVEKNDSSALANVQLIGKEYAMVSQDLIQVPVPKEAAAAHLELANSAANLSQDLADMATVNTDPLRAYLGLEDYQQDAATFAQAWSDMGKVFQTDQVVLSKGQPGSHFYSTCLLTQ